MKKLFLTFMSMVMTSFFLIACSSSDSGSNPPAQPYPQCQGLSGYDYEICIQNYYPGSTNQTGAYIWTTGVVAVNSSSQSRLSGYFESLAPNQCNTWFPNSSWLGGCERLGEYTQVELLTNNLSINQPVTVSIRPYYRSNVAGIRKFSATGYIRPSGDKLRVDARPFMIVIEQNQLYEGNMRAKIYLDGALLTDTSLSYYSSNYYDNNNRCVSEGGYTQCQLF